MASSPLNAFAVRGKSTDTANPRQTSGHRRRGEDARVPHAGLRGGDDPRLITIDRRRTRPRSSRN